MSKILNLRCTIMRKKPTCPCPNCVPFEEPKVKKVKEPKVYTLRSSLLKTIEVLANFTAHMLVWFGVALLVATVIGGVFFDLKASVVAAWFVFVMILSLALFFVISLILFVIYFMKKTAGIFVAFGLVITAAAWIFIAPDGTFIAGIGDTLTEIFSFVNNALF